MDPALFLGILAFMISLLALLWAFSLQRRLDRVEERQSLATILKPRPFVAQAGDIAERIRRAATRRNTTPPPEPQKKIPLPQQPIRKRVSGEQSRRLGR
jgi:hypothetical protein